MYLPYSPYVVCISAGTNKEVNFRTKTELPLQVIEHVLFVLGRHIAVHNDFLSVGRLDQSHISLSNINEVYYRSHCLFIQVGTLLHDVSAKMGHPMVLVPLCSFDVRRPTGHMAQCRWPSTL